MQPSPSPSPLEPAADGSARSPGAAWLLDRTEALCRADTTTGREDHGLPALRGLLRELGARIELQEVAPGRHNVLATWGQPRLLLSTHLDTVPPFLPPQRRGDVLHGRGACDAKGQITAQLGAIQTLLARGHDGFAWLGVVGEETDSVGASAAAELASRLASCRGLINGEPTENKLTTGQRGSMQIRLETAGRAAHSGTPELGHSAIWPLLDWLQALRTLPERRDPELGPEIWNLGTIAGGKAPNVVPDAASAMLFARTLPDSEFLARVRELAPPEGRVASVAATPPERFSRLPGFEHVAVTFGSDAPRLRKLVPDGLVAMCGPGSIRVAHTPEEHVSGRELAAGCALLVAVAETMLGGGER
ncbi:MAG: M20/M25/M40 family metallo-hydrolase [Planctomycetes bacterium]|nr:M20/M25/M40 family metallo-hydrolase [Planctomycetota bacterium]